MQKNGLRQEAHFRQELWQKGEWRDSLLYAILESEWKNNQQITFPHKK
jgi:RimJ/RimL family protein N-acetyltransferase